MTVGTLTLVIIIIIWFSNLIAFGSSTGFYFPPYNWSPWEFITFLQIIITFLAIGCLMAWLIMEYIVPNWNTQIF